MARDYAGEYARRNARAQERGFQSYNTERVYKVAHKLEIEHVKQSVVFQQTHNHERADLLDPKQLTAFYYAVEQYEGSDTPTGDMRHAAVQYFIEYEDMSVDEAIEEMRIIYGDTGED